ncbi:MAG: nucleotidyltransferase domain-containing protein [Chloroflexota bacterium]
MAIFNLSVYEQDIRAFCRRYYIQKLALFGSILRDDFNDNSDIDVLVEFHPEHIPGWEIVSITDELTAILGRPVDLRTVNELSNTFRDDVVQKAVIIYE